MTPRLCFGLCLAAVLALAQTAPPKPATSGARDLYFGGFDTTPPAPATTARKTPPPPPPSAKTPVTNVALKPLGLRYAIVKVDGATKREVPASTKFQAGDRIQVKVQSNSDAFLYIVSQGTSGSWQVLFPAKGAASNRIRAGADYMLPANSTMRFAGQPGEERLFVVLTRAPEPDLESVINNLKNSRPKDGPMEIASVADPTISKLRSSNSRDLVLEEFSGPGTTPDAAPAAAAPVEKATYIVSKNRGADARVVADIRLTHE